MTAPLTAQVISLDGKARIKVTRGPLLVGYFTTPEDITEHGLPVELAELEVTA